MKKLATLPPTSSASMPDAMNRGHAATGLAFGCTTICVRPYEKVPYVGIPLRQNRHSNTYRLFSSRNEILLFLECLRSWVNPA